MLTDIFLNRYAGVTLWNTLDEGDRRLLVQAFRIVSEQVFPDKPEDGRVMSPEIANIKWRTIHNKLSMELGLDQLSPMLQPSNYGVFGQTRTHWLPLSIHAVCKNFVCANYDGSIPADRFMKERISFIELAFRERADELDANHGRRVASVTALQRSRTSQFSDGRLEGLKTHATRQDDLFRSAVDELNERMRQAGYALNYHNGFIQVSADRLVEGQVERPFWELVADKRWRAVDLDMKEAIDRRDRGARDAAFHAAKALESTIKIISKDKGCFQDRERGAQTYISNLASNKFIARWEADALIHFFSKVRNPFGHGPGSEEPIRLSPQQTDWAIETCMSWTKSLIRRL